MADARVIITAVDQASQTIGKLSSGIDTLKSRLLTLAGGITFGYAVKEFIQAADAVTLMNARLKLVTGSVEEFNEARAESYRIAQANNVGLEETARLYTRLAEPIKKLGGDAREVAGIVEAFASSLRVGGASAQEASAATLQFAQAMGSGKLAGDEFRSLAEASPRFMKALADGIGVPTGALKEMAKEGKLTADVVGNALLKSLAQLKDEAATIPDTVGGALQRAKNDAFLFAEQINNATNASGQMAEVIGTTSELFREFGSAVGAASLELDTANRQFDLAGTAIAVIGTVVETLTVVFANVAYVAKTTATEIAVMWEQAKLYLSGNAEEARRIGDEWRAQAEANRRAIDKFSEGVVGATDRILQMREALKKYTISAQESNNELERMMVRSGRAAGAFATLSSRIEDTEAKQKAAKKATDEYAKAAKDVLDLTSKSLGVSGDYVEKLKALELWYSRNQDRTEEYRQAVEALIWAQESSKNILRQQEDAAKDAARAYEESAKATDEQRQAWTKAMDSGREMLDAIAEETEALQMTNAEREVAIKLRELERLGIERGTATYEQFAAAIREAVINREAVEQNIAATKQIADDWRKTTDQIENALTQALVDGFNGGKSIVKSIGEYIVNYFKTYVARTIAQALMGAIGLGLSGSSAASGGLSLLGGSSGGGLNLGTLGSLISGGTGAFSLGLSGSLATIGEMGVFGGFSNVLTSASSLFGAGEFLGAAGAAMPYLLPVAAGVYALTKLLGNKRSPAQQNYSVIGPADWGWSSHTPNLQSGSAYDEILRPVISSVEEIVAKLGGSAAATTYGLYTSASPDNLGAQVVAGVIGERGGGYYVNTNASNESLQARIAEALPQMLLAGLKDANIPEEFASYFRDLQIGSATAQQINDAIAAAVTAKESQDASAQAAQDATIDTAVYTSRTADLLEQQISILDRIGAGIEQLIEVTADVARRPIEVTVSAPEVNGGLT